MPAAGPIIFYDGVCGLCNRFVQFVLRRDRRDHFRFSPLQGPLAATVLARHGKEPARLDTVYVVIDPDGPSERLLSKARAGLFVLDELGGSWRMSRVLGLLPTPLLNVGYDLVARLRYRLFGKYDSCPLPDPAQRPKFLDATNEATDGIRASAAKRVVPTAVGPDPESMRSKSD